MRALTRMRTLAAACALLLVIAGTATAGGLTGRQIDRGGVPDPPPPMVGDPDDPQGRPMAIVTPWGYMTLQVPISALQFMGIPARAPQTRSVTTRKLSSRGAHAR